MTRVFIGGKPVKKEDLGKYETKNESLKKIIRDAVSRGKGKGGKSA